MTDNEIFDKLFNLCKPRSNRQLNHSILAAQGRGAGGWAAARGDCGCGGAGRCTACRCWEASGWSCHAGAATLYSTTWYSAKWSSATRYSTTQHSQHGTLQHIRYSVNMVLRIVRYNVKLCPNHCAHMLGDFERRRLRWHVLASSSLAACGRCSIFLPGFCLLLRLARPSHLQYTFCPRTTAAGCYLTTAAASRWPSQMFNQ
jgi:hypothetical protein